MWNIRNTRRNAMNATWYSEMWGFTKQAQQEQRHNKQTFWNQGYGESKRMQDPCRYQQHEQRRMQTISNMDHASKRKKKNDYELDKIKEKHGFAKLCLVVTGRRRSATQPPPSQPRGTQPPTILNISPSVPGCAEHLFLWFSLVCDGFFNHFFVKLYA